MEFNSRTVVGSVFKNFTRSLRHKPLRPERYPKVNIEDVDLNPPKYGFRRQREPIIAQAPTKTLFPNVELAKQYIEAGKRIPNRFMSQMDSEKALEQFETFQQQLELEEPHFKIGGNKIYFPQGRICLLRPNAKHTPYQAKFLVPKSMNKMDLRDYLWNIYGLRALNVTVQLLPAKWARGAFDNARYRIPQLKKMTVDMVEPFIWPEVPKEKIEQVRAQRAGSEKIVQHNVASGSDLKKPLDVYDGMYAEKVVPQRFIPGQVKRQGSKVIKSFGKLASTKDDRQQLEKFLGFLETDL